MHPANRRLLEKMRAVRATRSAVLQQRHPVGRKLNVWSSTWDYLHAWDDDIFCDDGDWFCLEEHEFYDLAASIVSSSAFQSTVTWIVDSVADLVLDEIETMTVEEIKNQINDGPPDDPAGVHQRFGYPWD